MAPPESDDRRKRRPPPNYFSRRVQTRLLMLVCSFMLVIFMMEEARKPKYYEWMWGDQLQAEDGAEAAGEVDTRIQPANRPEAVPGEISAPGNRYDEKTLSDAGRRRDDPVARAAIDAWGRMLGELTIDQRAKFDLALLTRRRGEVVDDAALAAMGGIVAALEGELERYVNNARETLVGNELLEEDELAAWESVLDQLESSWSNRWKPALAEIGDSLEPDDPALADIQSMIDELNLAAVRDNTISPPAERFAWFRFLEQLQAADEAKLKEESLGVVGFLQLHDQPSDYRGKVVTVRGHALMGYRVNARKNVLGVDEYQLLWLRPRGGPNTLIAVYCLNTPGLPPLKHKDRDRGVTELNHDVQITGYFFKKWAYRAHDGLRTAPQVLAKTVVVESAPWTTATDPPSNSMLMFVAIVAAVGGVGLAIVFFILNQWPSRASNVVLRGQPTIKIDPSQVSRGVATELKELEEAERGAEGEAFSSQPK